MYPAFGVPLPLPGFLAKILPFSRLQIEYLQIFLFTGLTDKNLNKKELREAFSFQFFRLLCGWRTQCFRSANCAKAIDDSVPVRCFQAVERGAKRRFAQIPAASRKLTTLAELATGQRPKPRSYLDSEFLGTDSIMRFSYKLPAKRQSLFWCLDSAV